MRKVVDFTLKKIDQFVKKKQTRKDILEVYVEYPKELHKKHKELSFFNIENESKKVEKLVTNLKDKKMHVVHIKNLNQH